VNYFTVTESALTVESAATNVVSVDTTVESVFTSVEAPLPQATNVVATNNANTIFFIIFVFLLNITFFIPYKYTTVSYGIQAFFEESILSPER
jgi:hypothetical protein